MKFTDTVGLGLCRASYSDVFRQERVNDQLLMPALYSVIDNSLGMYQHIWPLHTFQQPALWPMSAYPGKCVACQQATYAQFAMLSRTHQCMF